MKYLLLWRMLAITGLLGLVFLIILWNGWLTPLQQIPRSLEMLILLLPLIFFIRGTLHGKYSTHVHITFPALFYFTLGVWYAASSQESVYGILMTVFSLSLYLGGFMYAHTLMKRDKTLQTTSRSTNQLSGK